MNEIMEELICAFKNAPNEEGTNNGMEAPIIEAHTALESMETIYTFLLQQEDTGDMAEHISAIGRIEKCIQEKFVKSTVDS